MAHRFDQSNAASRKTASLPVRLELKAALQIVRGRSMTPSEIAEVYGMGDLPTNELLLEVISKQAEALKIATEALERIGLTPLSLAECIAESHQAIASIKEV